MAKRKGSKNKQDIEVIVKTGDEKQTYRGHFRLEVKPGKVVATVLEEGKFRGIEIPDTAEISFRLL